jgi:hypothetical protein
LGKEGDLIRFSILKGSDGTVGEVDMGFRIEHPPNSTNGIADTNCVFEVSAVKHLATSDS